jgi:hypothetical protein
MSRALGKVDLLGLNSFGQNPGLNPIWGAAIGGGLSGVTTLIVRHTGTSQYAEAIGFGTGLLASGAMFAMRSTRHAAWGGLVGTVLATGFALIEKHLFGAVVAPAPVVAAGAATIKGLGIPDIRALNGLGIPDIRALNGLGIPMMSDRNSPAGAIPGVAGTQLGAPGMPPVSLLGPGTPQGMSLLGMGGPAVHGLSTAYGATLLGGGR